MKKILAIFILVVVGIAGVSAAKKDNGPVRITDENYMEYLNDESRPVVIEFSATWCGPCRTFAPIYNSVAADMSGKFNFYNVDVDESPKLARLLGVTAVPTVLIINPQNEKVDILQGVVGQDEFEKRLEAIL